MKKFIVSSLFALAIVASGSAISIDSKRLLGYFDGSGPASLINDLHNLNVLIDFHNGASAPLPSTFQLVVGADVPAPIIASPTTYASGGDEARGISVPISAGAYDWVSLQSGGKTEFYYIGDLSGNHALFNGELAAGAVGETAQKLQETAILVAEATKVAKVLKGETKKLDLEALSLEAELKKQEKLKQEFAKEQQQLDLQQQILLGMQKLLEQQLANLDKTDLEALKQKEKKLLENQKLLSQKGNELQKLLEAQKKTEAEKKQIEAAKQKLMSDQLKKQKELQKQQKKQQELAKEKKRLDELKKAQLAQAADDEKSHYNFFGEKKRLSAVPDSGTTSGLLAFALAALTLIRRRS